VRFRQGGQLRFGSAARMHVVPFTPMEQRPPAAGPSLDRVPRIIRLAAHDRPAVAAADGTVFEIKVEGDFGSVYDFGTNRRICAGSSPVSAGPKSSIVPSAPVSM
jgi:hypothetical protein